MTKKTEYRVGDLAEYHEMEDTEITGWCRIRIHEVTRGLPTSFDFCEEPAKSKLGGTSACIGNGEDDIWWRGRFRQLK